jgi:hypothetical protein
MSAFASSYGVDMLGTTVNVRDAAPLTAGLIFSAPAGIISGAIGAFFYLSGRFWIGVIIGADATIAIDYGMERMFFVTLFTFVSAINQTLSHSLQAFGYPLFTSISNIAFTLGFRTVWMQFVYPRYQTFTNLMSCFLVSWLLNMTFYAIFFTFVYLRYTKKGICKKI